MCCIDESGTFSNRNWTDENNDLLKSKLDWWLSYDTISARSNVLLRALSSLCQIVI